MMATETFSPERVSMAGVEETARMIAPEVVRTPVLRSPRLNDILGLSLWFKAETLQVAGAFKYRGACSFLMRLSAEQRNRGVVAFSSGNHAQAVAAAANRFGVSAKIVMPSDAPAIKLEGTRAWGADVITYNRMTESREAIAGEIARQEGRTLIPPFDHPWTILGQATAGLEFYQQLAAQQVLLDVLLIPCSGGGLTAGVSTVFRAHSPQTQLWAVEPHGYDDTAQSLATGRRVSIQPPSQPTLCDSLALTEPGHLTLAMNQHLLNGVQTASDASVLTAMRLIGQHLKLLVEPGGAIGLAAVLEHPARFTAGQQVGMVLSGANVDPHVWARAHS
ncbi:MAG: threonine/serine dehydratase [Candidatus Melainabacteria bacterium]|nr:threonine/serine dehydratase [Candidatus Melainabacteria bacterium]